MKRDIEQGLALVNTGKDEITRLVSERVLEWWQEYKESGTVSPGKQSLTEAEDNTEDESEHSPEVSAKPVVRPRSEKPLTFADIRTAYQKPLKVISDVIEVDDPDETVAKEFENAMEEIMELFSQWKSHRAQKVAEAA